MAGPRKNKVDQLYEAAKALFMRHGVKRVSVEEICREARVSKMTFYKYFRNKSDLLKYIIRRMVDEVMSQYDQIMEEPIPFREKVKKMVQLKWQQTTDLSQEFFDDIHKEAEPEIRELIAQIAHESYQRIVHDFSRAQKAGQIRVEIYPPFLLYMLENLLQAAKDEKLLALYDTPQDLIMEITRFFFYGIFGKDET
ncbi:TetR/AcrR family transcriptional regulator [candidate division KSB1 bacterium]|nr:TetR/AcrR family transcriptional regulator [candidate division KSB1 bacterium]